jgi:hypothetical protein
MAELKIALCVPSTGQCRTAWAVSLASLVAYFAQKRFLPECDKQELSPFWEESSNICANRHKTVLRGLEWGATHILMLDEDLLFYPKAIELMVSRRLPVVGMNYVMRGGEYFTALSLNQQDRVWSGPDATGLEPCLYLAQGGTLIESRVYRAIAPPWFLQDWEAAANDYMTEDNYFFKKVRDAGFTPYVDHDASQLVNHVGTKHYGNREVPKHGR